MHSFVTLQINLFDLIKILRLAQTVTRVQHYILFILLNITSNIITRNFFMYKSKKKKF